jgi:hypothetical protein
MGLLCHLICFLMIQQLQRYRWVSIARNQIDLMFFLLCHWFSSLILDIWDAYNYLSCGPNRPSLFWDLGSLQSITHISQRGWEDCRLKWSFNKCCHQIWWIIASRNFVHEMKTQQTNIQHLASSFILLGIQWMSKFIYMLYMKCVEIRAHEVYEIYNNILVCNNTHGKLCITLFVIYFTPDE